MKKLILIITALMVGSPLNAKEYNPALDTEILDASKTDKVQDVKTLLSKNANPNAVDKDGNTPLHMACINGRLDVAKLLIKNGAKVNAAGKDGLTPLHDAALRGHSAVVRLLIENNAYPNAVDKDGLTPLHRAVMNGYLEVANLLIENGAKVDAVSEDGFTPLHFAVHAGHLEGVALLIEKGGKVNAADKGGRTPLHYAATAGHLDVAKLLIEKGAKVDAVSGDGITPLHMAAERGHLEVVKLLLENGASLEARDEDEDDETPNLADIKKTINFEFWNKSNETVSFALALKEDPTGAEVISLSPYRGRRWDNIATPNRYYLFLKTAVAVRVYKINAPNADSTVYIRLGEDGKKFGLQTGPLKGLGGKLVPWGKTESGLSLAKNIKDADVVQDEALANKIKFENGKFVQK